MRLALRAETPLEALALRLGLVPEPAGEAWGALALAAALRGAVELGIVDRLAAGSATSAAVAADLGLDPTATRLLLDCLVSMRYLARSGTRYRLRRRARRWLRPGPRSVRAFVAATVDYWPWWERLPDAVRSGVPAGHHDFAESDPYWKRYLEGQDDLARLSARVVARRLRIPSHAATVLDIGGGHGRYSMELCRRHPRLRATVLDLPGSVRVGREIVAAEGMSDRVGFLPGDARTDALPGQFDVVLCFNLIHHLPPGEVAALFTRIRRWLAPAGTVAVLDGFAGEARSSHGDVFGLFTFMSSGVGLYTQDDLAGWLRAAGFSPPRRVAIRPIPGLALYQADPA